MVVSLPPPLTANNLLLPSSIIHFFPKSLNFNVNLNLSKSTTPFRKSLTCSSLSVVSDPPQLQITSSNNNNNKPFPAEVSRTIMDLSSSGTLSTLTHDSWPIGVSVRFALDPQGTPLVCLNASNSNSNSNTHFSSSSEYKRSSLNVQLQQCGFRTLQCTILGNLHKPADPIALKRLQSLWEKRFGEEVDEDLIYVLAVERVLQIEDFMEDGVWISSSDYRLASPDPLRDFAEKIVHEINAHNMEDIQRFCNIYVDSDIQVSEAKMVWVDRLGFDIRISSPQNGVFEARIPFPREVTDEKGAKSSFNCMSQLAWEVERNYVVPDFHKVKQLKKIP